MKQILKIILSLVFIYGYSFASNDFATLSKVEGDIEIFSNPSKEIQGPPPHALYEGEHYSVQKAKVGDLIQKGSIVRSPTKGKAQLIYPNGDQVYVGAGSALRIFWEDEGKEKEQTTFVLLYGKIRSMISKSGPRNNLKVKSGNVVMGVRGTDFYVSNRGALGKVEVATIRGLVAVDEVAVKSGYSLSVTEEKVKPEPKKISIEKIKEIQNITDVKNEVSITDVKLLKTIDNLQIEAQKNVLKDIKTYDPNLIPNTSAGKILNLAELNELAIKKIAKDAPHDFTKPKLDDLNLEEDSYKRYFKIKSE